MKAGLYEKALDLAARIGPVCGGAGGLFYAGAYGTYFVKNKDLSDLAQVFFGLAFGTIAVGIGRALKKGADLYVAAEAEKRRDNPNLSASSDIPAIQREIRKQEMGSSLVATLPNKPKE